MAFDNVLEQVLEEFVDASTRADKITYEAKLYRRYLDRKEHARLYQELWRASPANRLKKLRYMYEYNRRPETRKLRNEYQKQYYAANRSAERAKGNAWVHANKERVRAAERARRAAKRAAIGRPPLKRMTDAIAESIVALRNTGLSYSAIERVVKVSQTSIFYVLKGRRRPKKDTKCA